jgi:hypothetical protein
MLVTVLVMALAVSVEPFRIGMTVLMLNRPRPALQLLALLGGGFAMGLTVGLVVLFVFRRALAESSHFTLPGVQMLIGTVALLVAAVVVISGRWDVRRTGLVRPAQRLLNGPSLAVAGVAGLGIALPSVDYLAALAVILASRAPAVTQVAVLVMFHVVAFALVEIPLLAYLLAPKTTVTWVAALHTWVKARRRAEVASLLAIVGCVSLTVGIAGL